MHNYFTACIYIVKVNIKWPRLPFQLGTRGWSTVWSLFDVEEKQSQNNQNSFEIWFFIRLQLYISSFTFFTVENFRYGTVVQYERMTVDMWWRNLILLVIAETIENVQRSIAALQIVVCSAIISVLAQRRQSGGWMAPKLDFFD